MGTLTVGQVARRFHDASFRWWITGRHALELHAGRSWRAHADIDVGIRRRDAEQLYLWLSDWEVFVGAAGRLSRWTGQPLLPAESQNNLWCRRPGRDSAWRLDVVMGSGDDDRWVYRRDAREVIPTLDAIRRRMRRQWSRRRGRTLRSPARSR